jgi:hypothetical protein
MGLSDSYNNFVFKSCQRRHVRFLYFSILPIGYNRGKMFPIPTWLIISVVVVLVIAILFKSMNEVYVLALLKKNFFYIFLILILIFITISLTKIHRTYNIDLTTFDGISAAGKIYLGWLVNVFSNIAKVTGYATQQNWVSNSTNYAK